MLIYNYFYCFYFLLYFRFRVPFFIIIFLFKLFFRFFLTYFFGILMVIQFYLLVMILLLFLIKFFLYFIFYNYFPLFMLNGRLIIHYQTKSHQSFPQPHFISQNSSFAHFLCIFYKNISYLACIAIKVYDGAIKKLHFSPKYA